MDEDCEEEVRGHPLPHKGKQITLLASSVFICSPVGI
jgi:hypothetical protein